MNNIQKRIYALEKKQKTISDKLDKYEYDYNDEKKKLNGANEFTFKDTQKNVTMTNFPPTTVLDKNYRNVLDNRLEIIMGKINDNIINQNYIDFYEFLLKGRPKYSITKSKNTLNTNIKQNSIKEENSIKDDNSNKIKSVNSSTNNNIDNNINNSNKNINDGNNNIKISNNIQITKNVINENQLQENNIIQQPPKKIEISYHDIEQPNNEDFENKKKIELLNKQQNIFLSNELTLLKCKLNKIRKENEFLQSLIHEKGVVKNTNVLEKFIGTFVEKLSLNWNDIVEMIIEEILYDEIMELNEIELNKMNYNKNKKMLFDLYMKNKEGSNNLSEEDNTNIDLLVGNIDLIKKIINSVKKTENELRAKYKFKK